MPFNLGPTELIILLVIVLVIFGAGKLPEIGGALGKSIREFKTSVDDQPAKPEETTAKKTESASTKSNGTGTAA